MKKKVDIDKLEEEYKTLLLEVDPNFSRETDSQKFRDSFLKYRKAIRIRNILLSLEGGKSKVRKADIYVATKQKNGGKNVRG